MEALLNEPASVSGEIGNSTRFKGETSNPLSGWSSTVFGGQGSLSDIAREMLQKLQEFEGLPENWDSYGAARPSRLALKNAQSFIQENHFLALPFYFIAPGVNGEVMIEFKQAERSAELYFNDNGSNELLLFQNDDLIQESDLEHAFNELIEFFNS